MDRARLESCLWLCRGRIKSGLTWRTRGSSLGFLHGGDGDDSGSSSRGVRVARMEHTLSVTNFSAD